MDVVPKVVSFAKQTPVIKLVVGSQDRPLKTQETRGRKRKISRTADEKEKRSKEIKEGKGNI